MKLKTKQAAELLLAAVIIARSISFLLSKNGLQTMQPFTLLSLRFLCAFLFLILIFRNRLKKVRLRTAVYGALLGAAFFAVMAAEMLALQTTDSATTALLENCAIIFVPLLEAILLKRFPSASAIITSLLCFSGVALLTIKGGALTLTGGELLCLLAALLYAAAIILTDRLAHKDDPLLLGILEVGFIGLFSSVAAVCWETPHWPTSGTQWVIILTLAVVCSGFGFTLQPVAQKGTTAERAGLFCALNPAAAVILGSIFLNEQLGLTGIIGAGLIVSGIFLTNIPAIKRKKKKTAPIELFSASQHNER